MAAIEFEEKKVFLHLIVTPPTASPNQTILLHFFSNVGFWDKIPSYIRTKLLLSYKLYWVISVQAHLAAMSMAAMPCSQLFRWPCLGAYRIGVWVLTPNSKIYWYDLQYPFFVNWISGRYSEIPLLDNGHDLDNFQSQGLWTLQKNFI